MKRKLFVSLAISFLMTSAAFAAELPATPTKCTETITLKKANAEYIIYTLGLDGKTSCPPEPKSNSVTQDPAFKELRLVWAEHAVQCMIPDGIDSVSRGKDDQTLVITGDQEAVKRLVFKISKLDILPQYLGIQADLVMVDSNKAAKLINSMEPYGLHDFVSPTNANIFDAFQDYYKERLGGPITCMQNNCPYKLNLQATSPVPTIPCDVTITPRIGADGTIDLMISIKRPYTEKVTKIIGTKAITETEKETRYITITQQARVADDDTCLILMQSPKDTVKLRDLPGMQTSGYLDIPDKLTNSDKAAFLYLSLHIMPNMSQPGNIASK
ncbi:MAG: hypothetical protein NT018_00335 [Armatimonadetes bacterium]|nr:hypothetical protein [Armatimonadota bacterium]